MGMSAEREFVSLAVASKILGVDESNVKKYADRRMIGVRRLPGLPPRYSRADLEALRDRYTIPAEEAALAVAS